MLGPLPLERVAWLTPLKHGATCVTIPNFVALDQTSWAYIGGPQFFWTLGPYLLGWGVADPLKTCYCPCVTIPDFVAVGQAVLREVRCPKN